MSVKMKDNLKIIFASTEMAPFAKVGGLADVIAGLPVALRKLGHDVAVFIPGYGSILEDYETEIVEHSDTALNVNGDKWEAFHLRKLTTEAGVVVFLICNDAYYNRDGIYTDAATGEGFADNSERFIFFSRAVHQALTQLDLQPDILHCNDHHTGLLVEYASRSAVAAATVFSIHNLAYQGVMPKEYLQLAAIDVRDFYPGSRFEYWGQINCMKIGIEAADAIIAVSPTYAEEIQTPEHGEGLDGVIRSHKDSLHGILNGVDYSVWNPESDPLIHSSYSSMDVSGKLLNKRALQKDFGLPQTRKRKPLLGMVSRLVAQKGLDILLPALETLLKEDVQVVILGAGNPEYHQEIERLAKDYPRKLGYYIGYNNRLAHLVEAGSDIFLMPSEFEPCGLNQLYSLKYGTIPIVHSTGGLKDSIIDCVRNPRDGTGFTFDSYSVASLLARMDAALEYFDDEPTWSRLMQRAMAADFSWDSATEHYLEVYSSLLHKKGSGL